MVKENTKIEIRPIPDRNEIKKYSENLEYFSQSHIIPPLVNPRTLKYETGLTEEDKKYLESINFPYDISDTYRSGTPHPFWESNLVKVELKNTPTFLYPGRNPLDFIKYKWLLKSVFVYNSEFKEGTKPQATHYIYNEGEELEVKASKIEKRNKLVANINKLSSKRKKEMLTILLDENLENKNDNYVTIKFEELIDNPETSREVEQLMSAEASEISMMAEIKKALHKNVLRKTKKGIFFFESNLGFTEKDVKDFLLDPENQEIYLTIKQKID